MRRDVAVEEARWRMRGRHGGAGAGGGGGGGDGEGSGEGSSGGWEMGFWREEILGFERERYEARLNEKRRR